MFKQAVANAVDVIKKATPTLKPTKARIAARDNRAAAARRDATGNKRFTPKAEK